MSLAATADVLIVEHAPQEGPYAMGTALEAAGLPIRACRTWAGDPVPESLGGAAALVVMGGPAAAYEDFPGRTEELALLRTALEAEVPVLGICLGAQLLAEAAGGRARTGSGSQIGWGEVRTAPAAHTDPLFADAPGQLTVLHWHGDTMDLPTGATLLASCDRYSVQAFRIGGSAWGVQFHLEVDKAAVDAFARFAALVAGRAARSRTRAFFTSMAATWEERFADDTPRYAAAVARMGLRPGQRALDVGCGSGRALPALRAEVGDEGLVLGVELTPAMLSATAAVEGRAGLARLLMADACRLPLAAGAVDGSFSAGLINHVPDPAVALCEWARVTAPGGVLLLYHPSGRAERAARHGRPLDPDDPLAEENLRPALHTAGWALDLYEDATRHFLARAVRVR
ncbi:methyltransferase domain-containing protein [Streptomyces sp. NPDC001700]